MTCLQFFQQPSVSHSIAALGGGFAVWFASFVKHGPSPKKDSLWLGAAFDATQDTFKNPERIGERRE